MRTARKSYRFNLGITLTTVGSTTSVGLALSTPRGDTAAAIALSAGATGPTGSGVLGINSWTDYGEYGQPAQAVPSPPGGITGIGYGWLGAKQRATPDIGLVLMGARLYSPATGMFTTTDPVYGGGATSYAYPTDQINQSDLNGTGGGDEPDPGTAQIGPLLADGTIRSDVTVSITLEASVDRQAGP